MGACKVRGGQSPLPVLLAVTATTPTKWPKTAQLHRFMTNLRRGINLMKLQGTLVLGLKKNLGFP